MHVSVENISWINLIPHNIHRMKQNRKTWQPESSSSGSGIFLPASQQRWLCFLQCSRTIFIQTIFSMYFYYLFDTPCQWGAQNCPQQKLEIALAKERITTAAKKWQMHLGVIRSLEPWLPRYPSWRKKVNKRNEGGREQQTRAMWQLRFLKSCLSH